MVCYWKIYIRGRQLAARGPSPAREGEITGSPKIFCCFSAHYRNKEHRYSIYLYDLFGDYDNIHRLLLFIIIFTITTHSTLHLRLVTFNNYLVRIKWKYWFARRYVWHVLDKYMNCKTLAIKLESMFGSTYIHETSFSKNEY